jgi:hypothetical protein
MLVGEFYSILSQNCTPLCTRYFACNLLFFSSKMHVTSNVHYEKVTSYKALAAITKSLSLRSSLVMDISI